MNYFIGRTQEQLEEALQAAQEELENGKQLLSSSVGESAFTFQSENSIKKRIQQIYVALNALDSDTYPASLIIPTTRAAIDSPDYR